MIPLYKSISVQVAIFLCFLSMTTRALCLRPMVPSLKSKNAFLSNHCQFRYRGQGSSTSSSSLTELSATFMTHYEELSVKTGRAFTLRDITPSIREILQKSGCQEGVVTVLSKHSTVSVFINEFEPRFVDDARMFLLRLAPPHYPWLHNDLDNRVGPPDWPGGDEAWRQFREKEPVNAHSHIIQMLLGTSESIPVHKGELKIGKYQNIIVADADGPKSRSICVQIMGTL